MLSVLATLPLQIPVSTQVRSPALEARKDTDVEEHRHPESTQQTLNLGLQK